MPKIAGGFALFLLLIASPAPAECLMTVLSCNATIDREINADDCIDVDQSHYDLYRIHGVFGEYVDVAVAPLDGSLTMPYLKLVAPNGNSSGVPFIGGGGTPRFRFILNAGGDWTLIVGTMRASDAGRYRLALQCKETATAIPPEQWYCVQQIFSCGQIARWRLDPSSCQFSDGGSFAFYEVNVTPGAPMQFRLHSDDFDPRLNFYLNGGHPLIRGLGSRYLVDGQLTYTTPGPPLSGLYFLAASATDGRSAGAFTLYGDCAPPPVCVPPMITDQPRSATITPGSSTFLNVTASGSGPFTYAWHDSNGPLAIASTATLSVTKPARTTSYSVDITNACGTTTSGPAVITVKPGRERTARH